MESQPNGYHEGISQYPNQQPQPQPQQLQPDIWSRQHQIPQQPSLSQGPAPPQLVTVPLIQHNQQQFQPQYSPAPNQIWNGQIAMAAPQQGAQYSPYPQIHAYTQNQPIGFGSNGHSPQFAYQPQSLQPTPQLQHQQPPQLTPQQGQPLGILHDPSGIATPSSRTYTTAFNDDSKQVSDATHLDALNSALKNPVPPYAIATTNNTNGRRSKTPVSAGTTTTTVTSPSNEANPNAAKKGFRNSRRRHRNSHLGCATCKSRRIKCDEQLPQCRNCVRARLSCAYLALDDAAREALKNAQQAHAARLQSLNIQANAQNQKAQQQQQQIPQQHQQHPQGYPYMNQPYFAPGLPSKIFVNSMPPLPMKDAVSVPVQVNLQRPLLPPLEFSYQSTPGVNGSLSVSNNNSPTESIKRPKSADSDTSSSATSVSGHASTQKPLSRFSIQADSFNSLATLIGKHQDIDPKISDGNAQFPEQFTEIVLDPNCTKHLNQVFKKIDWELIRKFRVGFEPEWLYREYDRYHNLLMKESQNNIVLFKSLLSTGAVLLTQYSKNQDVREYASSQLNKNFEITLRFLDKFKIHLNKEVTDTRVFYDNVNIAFSKFQIFQTAIPTTYFGSHNMNDNVELTSRFFNFIINYLNNEFRAFKDEEISNKFKDDELFQKAAISNDYMGVFIIYYVQCIKAYHTAPYDPTFFKELAEKIKDTRPLIYENLSEYHKDSFDNLVDFTTKLNEYFDNMKKPESSVTNHLQVLFYTMKKWYSILPEQLYIDQKYSHETYVLYSYYLATISSLIAIFPETRFYFIFSFNGRDGTRTANPVLNYYYDESVPEELKEPMHYPVKMIEFLKKRTLLLSQYLSDVSNLPAKILLDESNKHILRNLVKEEQLKSFDVEITDLAYPNIDETSSFYSKESNSIIIPSVSSGHGFSNFEKAQVKRESLLKKSVEDGLTPVDKLLIDSFFSSSASLSSTSSPSS